MSLQDQKLGQILIRENLVSLEDVAHALTAQGELRVLHSKGQAPKIFKLGEILLFSEKISLSQLHEALRKQTQKAQSSRVGAAKSLQNQISSDRVTVESQGSLLNRLKRFFK